MSQVATATPARASGPGMPRPRRTLVAAGVDHALHDGYTDLIYVLLPVWQAEFGLGYAALALLRSLYVGGAGRAADAVQPSRPTPGRPHRPGARHGAQRGRLRPRRRLGRPHRPLPALALAVPAAARSTPGLGGDRPCLRLAARGPLGTYNSPATSGRPPPALVGFLLTLTDWRSALWLIAGVGGGRVRVGRLLPRGRAPRDDPGRTSQRAGARRRRRGGFRLLVAVGMLDNAARPAFLLYLPFLLQEKGAALTTVGLALSLVFVGGAAGKGGLRPARGPPRRGATVILTETGTAVAILAVIALPLAPVLIVAAGAGVMLNGTSSVLYGTVPELAPGGGSSKPSRCSTPGHSGSSALAPVLYGRLGDAAGPVWAAVAAAATALGVVPLVLWLAPRLRPSGGARGS